MLSRHYLRHYPIQYCIKMLRNMAHSSLKNSQKNFIDTINQGPDALDVNLFEGPIDRIILGLKAHANTISHARLIALEETFPMTRESIGEDIFNRLSREFIALDDVKMRDNGQLGENFSAFIAQNDIKAADADLAMIEWLWLESYNAQDAAPLTLAMLSEFDEETLLSQKVTWHPSARLVPLQDHIAEALSELRDIIEMPAAILIIRPDVEVNLLPIDAITSQILSEAKNITPLSNLLEIASEAGDIENPLQPLLTLIGAGAFICRDV